MKFSMSLLSAFLLLGLISTSFAESMEYCKESIPERIRSLRNNLEVFKNNVAFDPFDSTIPISKYKTLPNGWISSYGINTDEVEFIQGVLQYMNYVDEHGDQQTLLINLVGKEYEVTHETEVLALLSTVQVLNIQEVQKLEYIKVLEKMIAMYKSAIQFRANLEKNDIPGIEGKVTYYGITADQLQFEIDFKLTINENVSKTEISGTYTCRFADTNTQMHGKSGNEYKYLVDSDDLTITKSYTDVAMF